VEGLKKARLLVLGISLAVLGCSSKSNDTHKLKATFYPLDLALTCDESTPSPLRSEYPAHDAEKVVGTACIERNSGVNAVTISAIAINRDDAFRDPVYEIILHFDPKDWRRVDATMRKALQSRRSLAYMVQGGVIARAFVMSLTQEGVIYMGGYDSVREAEAMASRFEIPRESGPKSGMVN
jgi:hypothetical protein